MFNFWSCSFSIYDCAYLHYYCTPNENKCERDEKLVETKLSFRIEVAKTNCLDHEDLIIEV